jgi:transposase
MFVDYAGQTVDLIDPGTGEIRPAQIFVAAMGASNVSVRSEPTCSVWSAQTV